MQLLRKPKPQGRKLYSTYADALLDCTGDAYENDELVRVIFDKTKAYRRSLNDSGYSKLDVRNLSLINTILQTRKEHVSVLDFGGAAGAHYFDVRKALPSEIKLNYTVVETPSMVKYASAFSSEELHFQSDFQGIDSVDIVHSSGTLQSVDDPYAYIIKLLNLKAEYILFNRLGFTLGDYHIVTTHESMLSWNGHGPLPQGYTDRWVKYPMQFLRKNNFMELMNQDYRLAYEFQDESGIFQVNDEKLEGKGMLFVLKSVSRF